MVLTPCFFMCSTIACAITSLPCGRRNSQWSWPGGVPTGEPAICTVLASAATGRHGGGHRRQAGAEDHVDLVLGDEAAGVAHALARVAGVVQDDQVDLLAGDLLGEQLQLLLHRDAQAGAGAGERQHHADVDVGQRGGGTPPPWRRRRSGCVRISWVVSWVGGERDGSARRHAQRAVEADHLAVEVRVGDDMAGELRELFGFAQALAGTGWRRPAIAAPPRAAAASAGWRTGPGAMVQTRMPYCARSRAIGSVMPTRPPLDAL